MRVNKKIVVSGNMVEIFEYEKGISVGWTRVEKENDFCSDGDSRERSLRRARVELIRLVNANCGFYGSGFTAKFVTLTFRDDVLDLDVANRLFMLFVKRLNYKVFGSKYANLRYTAVPEFTKRGRVHYHVIFYNLPYVKAKVLEQVWNNGFIKINKIDNVDNVGAYIAKYMIKASEDGRLSGRKCYFNSRGLRRPLEITDKKSAEAAEQSLPIKCLVYEKEYFSEYTGRVRYRQYNLKRLDV